MQYPQTRIILYSIYMLTRKGAPFYVGITSDMCERLKCHKKNFGNDIEIEEIEFLMCGRSRLKNALRLERYWIQQLRAWGFDLKNRNANPSYNYQRTQLKQRLMKGHDKHPKENIKSLASISYTEGVSTPSSHHVITKLLDTYVASPRPQTVQNIMNYINLKP